MIELLIVVKEFLEILHLLRVGYETGHDVVHVLNPKKKEQEKIAYDAADINTIKTIKTDAETYLTQLTGCVNHLENAKTYLLKIKHVTEELPNFLTNPHHLSSKLTEFMSHLHSANRHSNQFLLTLTPPPRQCLYRANSLGGVNAIARYNSSLNEMKQFVADIDQLKQEINAKFQEFYATLPTNANAEAIRESIPQCINGFTSLETILPTELATICTEIVQSHKEFKEHYLKGQPEPWENDPNWFPLLSKEDQLECGQRIFLHAMNETNFGEDEKLRFAELFLRKPVSKQPIKQVEVELKAYQMASILRDWQIDKCEQMIEFLQQIQQDNPIPSDDPDGLLAWLTTKRKKHNSIHLLQEILVSPCCLSTRSLDEVLNILKGHTTLREKPETLMREYEHIHWAAVWEKSDALIQFPKFQTEILPRTRLQPDEPSPLKVVSLVMQKLATALHAEITELKAVLQTNKMSYDDEIALCASKEQKALKDQKEQEHKLGVARIERAATRIPACTSARSSLYPYLYKAGTINEVEQKRRVPTPEDLLQIIYQGVNPNEVCFWSIESNSPPQQLFQYFHPNKPKDTRIKAWIYAHTTCQVNMLSL
ncbi:hypothetical protein, partial [Legionella sp.]|uniref:hypothetical protein n=1 Tax=Legionella sp. TaxID=459 RepID=UPI003C83A680